MSAEPNWLTSFLENFSFVRDNNNSEKLSNLQQGTATTLGQGDSRSNSGDNSATRMSDIERGYSNRVKGNSSDAWETFKEDAEENRAVICCCSSLLIVILIIVLVAESLAGVEPIEVGLEYDDVQGVLYKEPLGQGLHTIAPFGRIIKWPAVFETLENSRMVCNSFDGILMVLDISFQFIPRKEKIYDLTIKYGTYQDYKELLDDQAMASIAHVCGTFDAEKYQTDRSGVAAAMYDKVLRDFSSRFHCDVKQFQLRNIKRPAEYETIVTEKENARSDIRLAENERNQRLTSANTDLESSRQQATKILVTANATAAILLKKAQTEAESTLDRYNSIAEAYGDIATTQGFSSKAILAYLGNELFSTSKTTLAASSPSKFTGFFEEL